MRERVLKRTTVEPYHRRSAVANGNLHEARAIHPPPMQPTHDSGNDAIQDRLDIVNDTRLLHKRSRADFFHGEADQQR